jgi:TrmH family RNA methyltransferase
MTILQLIGKHNPLLKTIRLVSSGSRRAPKGLVFAEGVRVLEEAEEAGCPVEAVLFSEHFGSHAREKRLLDGWRSKGVRLYRTQNKLLESVSSVQAPQGVVALVRVADFLLEKVVLPKNPLILCACGIQDPGNLGTLIRTAAAAGVCFVCTTRGTVSARNPKAIRSSAGVFFRLPILENIELCDFEKFCNLHSIRLYRADSRIGVPYTQADLRSPCAIMLGNEGGGLGDHELSGFPAVRIPMTDGVESLNVAIAGAVILFEAFKQRMKDSL